MRAGRSSIKNNTNDILKTFLLRVTDMTHDGLHLRMPLDTCLSPQGSQCSTGTFAHPLERNHNVTMVQSICYLKGFFWLYVASFDNNPSRLIKSQTGAKDRCRAITGILINHCGRPLRQGPQMERLSMPSLPSLHRARLCFTVWRRKCTKNIILSHLNFSC